MPFILARRSEIQNGSIQITDLFPNVSQRNLVNDPIGQGPFYVRVPNLGATGRLRPFIKTNSDGSLEFLQKCNGLVAYLIANVEADPNGAADALTVLEAEEIATSLVDSARNGATLTLAEINKIIQTTTADGELNDAGGTDSTGTVAEVLAILAGEDYIVNGGVPIQTAAGAFADAIAPGTLGSTMRTLVANDSSWKISFSEGTLAGLVSNQPANLEFAGKKATTPLLTVYNDDGTIYAG